MVVKQKEKFRLVIVESPAKAKTINKYLGEGYRVSSSIGHIIDLPKSKLGVDVENNFEPHYITIRGKAKILNELRRLTKKSIEVLLASDPDREGEAISWHLARELKKINPNVKRISFNEITKRAVNEAIKNPRDIDMAMVNAQQARRILDRLVGYNLSPLLWEKIKKNLSAGRVQSVALRLICEREEEIKKFIPMEYWTLTARFLYNGVELPAELSRINDSPISKDNFKNIEDAFKAVEALENAEIKIDQLIETNSKRRPAPPFVTSTLQQTASTKLGFPGPKTMAVAQQLYMGVDIKDLGTVGLISYMRTDSTRISDFALQMARSYIKENYPPEYLPERPNIFIKKNRSQDAHEAIRPTDMSLTPDRIRDSLNTDQYKLYKLIYNRFLCSQMSDALYKNYSITIKNQEYIYKNSLRIPIFDGFLILCKDDKDSQYKDLNDSYIYFEKSLEDSEIERLDNIIEGFGDRSKLNILFEKKSIYYKFPIENIIKDRINYLGINLKIKDLDARIVLSGKKKVINALKKELKDFKIEIQHETLKWRFKDVFEKAKLGDSVKLKSAFPEQKFTLPPARYNDGSIVKKLKELEIGRPSTYAPTINTLIKRYYVTRVQKKFYPTLLGNLVNDLITKYFSDIVNYEFTAGMEKELDLIAENKIVWTDMLKNFYDPFMKIMDDAKEKIANMKGVFDEETDIKCEKCGKPMIKKLGKFGYFLACSGFPDCRNAKPIPLANCPIDGCNGYIVEKRGRKRGSRSFYGCTNYPDCEFTSWDRPNGEICPKCGKYLYEKNVKGKGFMKLCINPECDYEESI